MGKGLERGAVTAGLRERSRDEAGFTLLEILVTLTIIAILVAIAVPSYLGYQRNAKETTAESNLRAALPSVEAYFQDHASYSSMTVAELESSYDQGIAAGVTIVSAAADTYCVRSTHGEVSFFKNGPGAAVTTAACT
jgi:type IV pilus assembly protein PilA